MNSKKIDYKEAKEILKKPWMTREDIYRVYPVGNDRARHMFLMAKKRGIEQGMYIPVCRPPVVLTKNVLELFPIVNS